MKISVLSKSLKKPSFKISDVSVLFENFYSNTGITILVTSSGGDTALENYNVRNGALKFAYLNATENKIKSLGYKRNIFKGHNLSNSFIEELYKTVVKKTKGK